MKIKGSITISRNSRDTVTVRLRDELSYIEFASIELSPHDFCMALTGLSEVKGAIDCRGLEYVGMERITESRSVVCPINEYDREKLSKWIEDNMQEDGWLVSTYLGAQSSVEWKDGKTILNYSVTKYVKPRETT